MSAFNQKPFGGNWTKEKLDILEGYLSAYTTALKNKRFNLLYIDAFAGTGEIELNDDDATRFISGSAKRAVNVDDRPFDELIFIEKDSTMCSELEGRLAPAGDRNIVIKNKDANLYLRQMCRDWTQTRQRWRGVLFLDPFAMQVEWETVEAVANTEALDVWLLFPVSAVARNLPLKKKPNAVSKASVARLNLVFGDGSWKNLYDHTPQQQDLFGGHSDERVPGVKGIVEIYKHKLENLVGERLLSKSMTLTALKNSPLFELIFFAGNPRGTEIAHKIAKFLLEKN